MGPVDLGAGFLHAPALVSGELEPGQAAHVVVVRSRGTGDDRRHPVNVGVPDQQGPIAMVVSHLASFGPVGGVGHRSAHTTGNTGYARQDQADLCLQTPPSLVVSLVVNGHADSPLLLLGVGNCLALSEMEPGDPDTEGARSDPARLLALTLSRPQDALVAARSVLAGDPSPYDASLAHHAIGIVLRDRGDLPGAITELRKGLRLARACGRPEREVDVQATLGLALAWTGRSQQGLAILDQAVQSSRGDMAGRVLMRRASVLRELGRFHDALQDLNRALPYFRRAGDTVWEARSLTHRAEVFLGLGLPGRAAADYARAEEMYATSGQEFEYAKARHNSGCVALIRGDLPQALTNLDEARNRYDALGETNPDLAGDRCLALLAAGLAAEAAEETDSALSRLPPGGGIAYKKGELLFAAATAALAAGHLAEARQRAGQAGRLFRTQGRPHWEARTALVLAEARYAGGGHSLALLRYTEQVAARLESARAGEAMHAHLLAGRIALTRRSVTQADPHLERAARSRRRGPPLPRSVAWLARALQADAQGNARATVAACARGLDALEEHQMRLGATELRAYGTAHGAELATLAQRDALRRGDVRRLLFWSERWRATALTARSTPLRDDKELAAELQALRSVSRLLGDTEMAAARRNALERERRRLEAAVQARTRRLPGRHEPGEGQFNLDELFDELGPATLIELVTVDSVLHVVVVADRRVRLHTVGIVPEREVQLNRFVLRRLAHGRRQPGDEIALKYRGAALEAALLGDAVAGLGDGAMDPHAIVARSRRHRGAVRVGLAACPSHAVAIPAARRPRHRSRAGHQGRGDRAAGFSLSRSHAAGSRQRHGRPGAHRPGRRVAGAYRGSRHVPGR
jgi:tetratricopeptide (TPR) repeat protein